MTGQELLEVLIKLSPEQRKLKVELWDCEGYVHDIETVATSDLGVNGDDGAIVFTDGLL